MSHNYQGNIDLTVSDGSDEAVVSFYPDMIVVSVNRSVGVIVKGEDLFAFRELLAELPESAFTRPADPVEVPRWTDGDVIRNAGCGFVYVRDGGEWRNVTLDSGTQFTDEAMSHCVDDFPDVNVVLFQQNV